MAVTNTLAYYDTTTISAGKKSFIVQDLGKKRRDFKENFKFSKLEKLIALHSKKFKNLIIENFCQQTY